ncbi:cobyrinic acid a,c-diamide synthase [Gammaproteobacteria bacterium]|nr:cobyrinic acid a,c-diamide synthase [Gammaproteobacteria bacterium]
MEIITVINCKGGVGKTTVTTNLAAELAMRGKRVLLLDVDAQASLTFSLISQETWKDGYKHTKTIKSWFDALLESHTPPALADFIIRPEIINNILMQQKSTGCVDLICSHLGLLNIDLNLAMLLPAANNKEQKRKYRDVHSKLKQALSNPEFRNNYDVMIIDCPPNFNIVTKNAIIASHKILIPAKPDYLSILGIEQLLESLDELIKEFNDSVENENDKVFPEKLGVVFTMIQLMKKQPIVEQKAMMDNVQEKFNIHTFNNYIIGNNSLFSVSAARLIPAIMMHGSSPTNKEIVFNMKLFVDEIESMLDFK